MHRLRGPVVAVGVSGAAATAVAALYARSFGQHLHLLGADAFSYAWQIRALRVGLIGATDPRPGTLALGASLQGLGVLPESLTPLLMAIALSVVIGLGVASILRGALDLPAWTLFPIAVAAATFGGTSRLTGYLANMVSIACFVAGVAVAFPPPRRRWVFSLAAATAAFLAAGLAHPAILPAWLVIVAGWVVLTVTVRWIDRRREPPGDPRPIDRRPLMALTALVVGGLASLWVVVVGMRRAVADLGDLELVTTYFGRKLVIIAEWIAPVLPLTVFGFVVALVWGWRGGDRTGQWLLVAWVGACLAGVGLMLVSPSFPGHRALMLAVPLGALSGVGAVWVVRSAARLFGPKGPILWLAGAVLCVLLASLTGVLGLQGFTAAAARPWRDRAVPARQVAAFARSSPSDVPLVMVFEPKVTLGALLWKVRLNITRSFLDGRRASHLTMYVGDPRRLLDGQPTTFPSPSGGFARALNGISERTWPDVSAAIDDGATIVVPRGYVSARTWRFLLANGARLTGDGLAVIAERPVIPSPLPRYAWISPIEGWWAVVVAVVALGLIGGGYALLFARDTLTDRVAVAPAAGVVVLVLVGTPVAISGADPGGGVSRAIAVALGIVGWVAAARGRREER